jgi:hypothetical protein
MQFSKDQSSLKPKVFIFKTSVYIFSHMYFNFVMNKIEIEIRWTGSSQEAVTRVLPGQDKQIQNIVFWFL